MPAESVTVRERIQAAIYHLGVAPDTWAELEALSATERSQRCRRALTEIEAIGEAAPAIALQREVAQALLACCWLLALDAGLKRELRNGLLELARLPADEVALDRQKLLRLVQQTVMSYQ